MRRIFLGLTILALACKCGSGSSQDVVVVTVDAPAGLPGITQLSVTFSNGGTSAPASYPATPSATPIVFPTTLSASMPTSRTGSIGVSIDGLDAQGTPVAHGEASQDLVSGGETDITVTLAAVTLVPDAGAGGHGGAIATGGGMAGAGGSAGGGGSAGRDAGRDATGGAGGTGGNVAGTDAGVDAPADTAATAGNGGAGGTGGAGGLVGTDAGLDAPHAPGTDARPPDGSGGAGGTGDARGSGGNVAGTDASVDSPGAAGTDARPADSGAGGTGGADSGTDGSTPACEPTSTGGIACPLGWCTVGSFTGWHAAYSDGNGSSICTPMESLCAAGSTAVWDPPANTVWGAAFEVNLSPYDTTTSLVDVQLPGTGVSVSLSSLPTPLSGPWYTRIGVTVAGTDYCAVLTAASQTVPWTSFNTTCWSPSTGTYLTGAPKASSISFGITSGPTVFPFDFCVTALSFQ